MNDVKNPMRLDDKLSRNEKERAASLVEYALLIALIAVVAILAVRALGTQVSTNFSEVTSNLIST